MPVLHMQTENVRVGGQRQTQIGEQIDTAAAAALSLVNSLRGAWQGPSADAFFAEADSVLSQLRALAEQGTQLGSRVQREAEEWEQVDGNGMAGMIGSGMLMPEHSLGLHTLLAGGGVLLAKNAILPLTGEVLGISTTQDASYVSGVNRGLYDSLLEMRDERDRRADHLETLKRLREEEQEMVEELERLLSGEEGVISGDGPLGRFINKGFNLIGGVNDDYESMLADAKARVEKWDELIASTEDRIAVLDNSIQETSLRLERVQPPVGADIELIKRLEGSTTPGWLKNQTETCVRHVLDRMPIPAGLHPPNAKDWIQMPSKYPEYGVVSGDVPLEGSVIVLQSQHPSADNTYGHVMYVEEVRGDTIVISDNVNPQPHEISLSELTDGQEENVSFLYFPWHTKA